MKVGLAGLGFMGAVHFKAWQAVKGFEVSAVMSSSERKLTGDLTEVGGNLSVTPERFDFSALRKYTALEDLISDPALDVIDLCLPTYLHVDSAIAALRAGKHVFVEKPIALDAGRAQEVIHEAELNHRKLMVGHVLRFIPAYAALARILKNAGPVGSALFRRRCAAPAWGQWLNDPSKSGGALIDLLIHDIDYCISLWGMPGSVRAVGYEDSGRGIDVSHCELRYADLGPVIVTGGFHHPKSYPFSMEFTVSTADSTLDWRYSGELKEYQASGAEQVVPLDEQDPFACEIAYFASTIEKDVIPLRCPPGESAQAVALCEMLRESRKHGGKEIPCTA